MAQPPSKKWPVRLCLKQTERQQLHCIGKVIWHFMSVYDKIIQPAAYDSRLHTTLLVYILFVFRVQELLQNAKTSPVYNIKPSRVQINPF